MRLRAFSPAFLLFLWFFVPFFVLFFGNYFADLLTERKLLLITPAVAIMIALGLSALDRFSMTLLIGAILLSSLTSVDFYREKEPWNDITGEVLPYIQPDHLAITEIGVGQYPIKYYWSHTLPEGVYVTTFPFLGDPTMAPTTDWYTYYNGLLPQVIQERRDQNTDSVATTWMIFWSGEMMNFQRLQEAEYTRTMRITYPWEGDQIEVYRYDHFKDAPLAVFENGIELRAAEIAPHALRVDLWWDLSGGEPISFNYTTSALLLDDEFSLVAQLDSPPFYGERPTSTFQPGEVIYDPKLLELRPALTELPPGQYTVVAQMYFFTPEGTLQQVLTTTGDQWVEIGTLER